jgi:hypothetical protein
MAVHAIPVLLKIFSCIEDILLHKSTEVLARHLLNNGPEKVVARIAVVKLGSWRESIERLVELFDDGDHLGCRPHGQKFFLSWECPCVISKSGGMREKVPDGHLIGSRKIRQVNGQLVIQRKLFSLDKEQH